MATYRTKIHGRYVKVIPGPGKDRFGTTKVYVSVRRVCGSQPWPLRFLVVLVSTGSGCVVHDDTMISNFFVLSLRGDTILAKQYQQVAAHDRAQTEALFRKLKFWDDHAATDDDQEDKRINPDRVGDAPPVLAMPDGQTYFHIKRNGLIFGASAVKNVSPNTVLEVSFRFSISSIRQNDGSVPARR